MNHRISTPHQDLPLRSDHVMGYHHHSDSLSKQKHRMHKASRTALFDYHVPKGVYSGAATGCTSNILCGRGDNETEMASVFRICGEMAGGRKEQ